MKNQLWVEKYRPKTVEEYVFTDERLKQQVTGWVKEEMIPHLLFSGDPGTGKTTLAKVLIHDLGIEEYDVLQINASRERQIDLVRDRLMSFAQTMPFGKFKDCRIVDIIDEEYEYLIWLSKNTSIRFSLPVMEELIRRFAGYLEERHYREEISPWEKEYDNYGDFDYVPC